MACPNRIDIPSKFVGTTTHAQTEHAPPSVLQHIRPEESCPQSHCHSVRRDRPTGAKLPCKPAQGSYAQAREQYDNARHLHSTWRGESTSGILSQRNVRTGQNVIRKIRQWRLNWSRRREALVLHHPTANSRSTLASHPHHRSQPPGSQQAPRLQVVEWQQRGTAIDGERGLDSAS